MPSFWGAPLGAAHRARTSTSACRATRRRSSSPARTFADTARGPAFGLPPVATREMVVERGAGARRRAAAALGVAARGGAAPADLVLVRLGRAGYLAYLPDGFGRAGEFLCLYALLDPGLATFRGLCG